MDNTIVIAILSSGAFTAIINFLLNYLHTKNESKSNINKALMCLLGYEIKGECHRLIKQKSIDLEDLEQLQELNNLYHKMGGNGYVKSLMDRVERLEVKHND